MDGLIIFPQIQSINQTFAWPNYSMKRLKSRVVTLTKTHNGKWIYNAKTEENLMAQYLHKRLWTNLLMSTLSKNDFCLQLKQIDIFTIFF
jgi:hypothetical protein